MADFKPFIAKVAEGMPLSVEEASAAFDIVMSGAATPSQIGAFLMGLRVRGETVNEITGAVRAMRTKMLPVAAPDGAMDVVGTGGDGAGTFNVSTGTAFVVAGCGVPVAKHGNRALSSKSGSADVLTALGVAIDRGPDTVARCIAEAGLGFMFAPAHHAAMKHVGPTRVELGTRTLFNILGPLSNPAGVKRLLIGVFARRWVEPIAEAMRDLGAESVWVVHGHDGLDEVTTTGPTHVAELKDGKLRTFEITPADAGIEMADARALRGGDAGANSEAVRALLAGEASAYRDIVVLNAAAALVVAGKAQSLGEGAELAQQAIDTGAARARLEALIAVSNA